MISSRSGRPIVPFAVATSRYRSVNSWSRMTINLPFSRLGIAMGEPIQVPRDASPEELETYRQRVEAALNETTAKAYALAGADMTRATPIPRARVKV
jgi:3-deoxy-D-manno-octulosonic-acid transferase